MRDAESTKISVAVCTYDRYAELERCVASLERQALPTSDYEILIVDNYPDRKQVRASERRFSGISNLRYVHNTPPGLSLARNRAFAECRSPLIAFTDDDVVPNSDWLERIVAFFDECDSDVGSLTGKVLPLWECERPAWLDDRWLGLFALADWGEERIEVGDDAYPVGANLTYRMTAAREAGEFSPKFGRCGPDSLMSNDEFDYRLRLEAAGWKTYYAPDVVIRHAIPAERATTRWLCRRIVWQSISNAAMVDNESEDVRALRDISTRMVGWEVSFDELESVFELDDFPDQMLAQVRRIESKQSSAR